jgi:hypothetical protein
MITRRKVRRVALYAGVAIGALSLVALLTSAFRAFSFPLTGGARSIVLARGSVAVYWDPFQFTGFASYVVDPTDPFPDGYTIGDIW